MKLNAWPIETAPRDGTYIKAMLDEGAGRRYWVSVVYWANGVWWRGGEQMPVQPKFWRSKGALPSGSRVDLALASPQEPVHLTRSHQRAMDRALRRSVIIASG